MKSILFLGLVIFLLAGCSSDTSKDEKGVVDEAVEKVATEIVQSIQQPIDKAEAVKALEEQRIEQYKKQTE